ncbi:hypothetical protein J2I47_26270 [Fibrella sp. HMF5335]|uniref:Uncharacterized protein n=1 Tax=Fibrella rubiginis TaxID=2817060 RepID=A0A939GLI1_9BACT|nr:hypothetical protein [Fibrella rubiginis]MBO0940078.1 hypothetical protein [Fibrella rubiginis]
MAYKPVPTTQKVCVRCNTIYYAKDRRRLYCSSSCNTLAWMDRRGLGSSNQSQVEPKKAAGGLEFSLNNIGTIATGVLVADTAKVGLNALFDVQPTNAQIMAELKALRQENARLTSIVSGKLDAVAGSVFDAKLGLAATGPEVRNAIIGSEQRRKNLPPPIERGH